MLLADQWLILCNLIWLIWVNQLCFTFIRAFFDVLIFFNCILIIFTDNILSFLSWSLSKWNYFYLFFSETKRCREKNIRTKTDNLGLIYLKQALKLIYKIFLKINSFFPIPVFIVLSFIDRTYNILINIFV